MEYLVVGIAVAVLLLVGIAAFVVTRRRGESAAPPEPSSRPSGAGTGTTEEADTASGDVGTAAPPDESLPPTAEDIAAAELLERPLERPAPAAGRLVRLRSRLARSQSTFGKGLLALLSRERLDEDTWEEIEDALLSADLGVTPTQQLVERLRTRARVEGVADAEAAHAMLREELVALVDPTLDRTLRTERHLERPAVVLVVGVNGTGKTTTVGKLARVLVAEDRDVVLAAADTFRAAAVDQLTTWGDRVGVPTVRGPEGADPASVAFDGVRTGIELEADAVIVDTAGRLQTKVGLMDELGKVKRVVERHGPVDEVLLVLDATTGQNGLAQARVFTEVVDVTGIVLTKLDGTAKGGIVVTVQRELDVPVKLVGLGEGPDDLAPFDAEEFVDGLLG